MLMFEKIKEIGLHLGAMGCYLFKDGWAFSATHPQKQPETIIF
jgi:hypothetical protein